MNKISAMPTSGSMHLVHSKKLEWALKDFIISNGGTYYDEELCRGILKSYFKLNNGICVEQRVHIRRNDYICYTTLSYVANSNDDKDIMRCIKIANSINEKIDYGHFEVNEKTGDILFKSFYEPDDKVYLESLDNLLGYPMRIINKYGSLFLSQDK